MPGPPAGAPPDQVAGVAEVDAAPRPERVASADGSAISQAIDQVTRVIDELKHALDEMEEVLETLEFAERQKIDDEREIESLQRALRQLHRPAHGGGQHGH
jgi:chaperonin cofactor prefoldin